MTKTVKTTRELASVPAGEHDLVSGKPNGKSPAVKLSAAKVKAAATPDTRPVTAKAAIRETVKEVRAANANAHAGRMASCTKAAETAKPAKAAKVLKLTSPAKMGKAKSTAAAVKAAETKVRAKGAARAAGMDPKEQARIVKALISAMTKGSTSRANQAISGLSRTEHKRLVRECITGAGYKLSREANPNAVKGDSDTLYVWKISQRPAATA